MQKIKAGGVQKRLRCEKFCSKKVAPAI